MEKVKPIEFFLVATDAVRGRETWFRTAHIQGFPERIIAEALRTGGVVDGYRWRKVPVSYRIVTAAGQEFRARWDGGRNAFVTDGGFLVRRGWCAEMEEVSEDGHVQG